MKLDIFIHRGHEKKPVAIFIHGLAMDKNIWLEPLETRVIGRSVPLKFIASRKPRPRIEKTKGLTTGKIPSNINIIWDVLRDQGYNLICWSQRRPVGPISAAVAELKEIVKITHEVFGNRSIALIGHSRGGLVARKFMESGDKSIRALITIGTPHKGSTLSRVEKVLVPVATITRKILPEDTHSTLARIMQSIHELVSGKALKELMPEAEFFRRLKDRPIRGVRYISFGGRKTELLKIYRWKRIKGFYIPAPLISIPDSIVKRLPPSMVPEELRPGHGDILVTTESAMMPWAEAHFDVQANHFSLLWNKKVIKVINEVMEEI